jgi:hypothetical protein
MLNRRPYRIRNAPSGASRALILAWIAPKWNRKTPCFFAFFSGNIFHFRRRRRALSEAGFFCWILGLQAALFLLQ